MEVEWRVRTEKRSGAIAQSEASERVTLTLTRRRVDREKSEGNEQRRPPPRHSPPARQNRQLNF